jgi:hypothetical protein
MSNTSARTSLINCSALLIWSGLPESSTDLVGAPGSASWSLVTWIFAPDWSWIYLIVSPAFPIITPTYSKLTTVPVEGNTNITLLDILSYTTINSVTENELNKKLTLPFGISIFLLVPWYPPYEEYCGALLWEDNGGIEAPCPDTETTRILNPFAIIGIYGDYWIIWTMRNNCLNLCGQQLMVKEGMHA